jgi:cytochrome c-type biogenesis protein CcmE
VNGKKLLLVLGFLGIAAGAATLLTQRVSENTVYYYTVSEALDKEKQEALRISGKVLPGSIQKDAEKQLLQFRVYDEKNETIAVRYQGPVPDIFNEDIEVVVEGKIEGEVFVANNLLAKCPSKYERDGSAEDFKDVDIPAEWKTGEKS